VEGARRVECGGLLWQSFAIRRTATRPGPGRRSKRHERWNQWL